MAGPEAAAAEEPAWGHDALSDALAMAAAADEAMVAPAGTAGDIVETLDDDLPLWASGWAWAFLALIAALPVLLPPLPMMPDLFSHIGRYHVMLHGADSPWLVRYYAFDWRLIGNLGIDLLMLPLGTLLPTESAARLAVALIPMLGVAGIHATSTAVWGRVQAPALLALPLLLPFTFVFGFVNFHLGIALALLAFAAWLDRRATRWELPLAAALAGIVWVTHLAAWAVLLVMVAGWQAAAALRGIRASDRDDWPQTLWHHALPVMAFAWPLLLHAEATEAPVHKPFWVKWFWLRSMMRGEWADLDIALAFGLAGTALGLLIATLAVPALRRRLAPGLLLAALGLFVCFLAMPWQVMGSAFADTRLLPPLFIVLLLGLPEPGRRLGLLVAVAGVALFGLRVVEISDGWNRRGRDAVTDLSVLATVPVGARIAVLAPPSTMAGWALPGHDHLPSLAIARREAFVNTEWDTAAPQLMRPVYNRDYGFNEALSARLRPTGRRTGGMSAARWLAALPRQRFDYVWSFDAPLTAPWLRETTHGIHGRLYKIVAEPVIKKVKKARRKRRR